MLERLLRSVKDLKWHLTLEHGLQIPYALSFSSGQSANHYITSIKNKTKLNKQQQTGK